jgi:RNase H-like domain found in reverse transcriptase/Reverse transcriptase (RNA-dependent DNA polymerase)
MYSASPESQIVDLYSMESEDEQGKTTPFLNTIKLHGPQGEIIRLNSTFDDGAMVNAIDLQAYQDVKHRLKPLGRSNRILRMADGRLVPSIGVWSGDVTVGDVSHRGTFEVFNSSGAWSALFGKPLLRKFKAVHDYDPDTVRIPNGNSWTELQNQYGKGTQPPPTMGLNYKSNQCINFKGDQCVSPVRQVFQHDNCTSEPIDEALIGQAEYKNHPSVKDEHIAEQAEENPQEQETLKTQHPLTQEGNKRRTREERFKWQEDNGLDGRKSRKDRTTAKHKRLGRPLQKGVHPPSQPSPSTEVPLTDDMLNNPDLTPNHKDNIWNINTEALDTSTNTEQKILPGNLDKATFTRQSDPFKVERVDAVLAELTIGDDLTEEQRVSIVNLLREFADCFALSMSEVTVVEGATHKLNIPEGTTFKKKVNQRPLTAPQKEYFNSVLDKMLEAGIIAPIDHKDVKCCGATTLAKKAHEGKGLTIEELQHRVNEECITAGIPPAFNDLPPQDSKQQDTVQAETQTKWRVCQDFGELNKVTKVPPMPQGDIRAKQQRLSGHRWINTFDFAAGFYACEIGPEDQPYVCFYVEGRGYFCYKRMPFGLTGAPSTFAEMTAQALGDLVGILFELFVDDGGMAGDDFTETLTNIRTLLTRVREKGLSLSATKSSFFMTEAVFAGGRVGPTGIKPDLTKLTAIVDWKRPTDLQNLSAFTGLTGYFRSLIKGYAALAQPLTDLMRSLDLPKGKGKAAYRRAMKGHSLLGLWKEEHEKAFLGLKVALTNEPVLKGPKFDGTPFVVTTDGCKYGFAGMLSQRHTAVLPNGKEVTHMHPVAFSSKRTSESEEKYKPYLLEFAALKFSLDKFSDLIWGYPVELETDCQALRDHLLNDKLNSTHARWRDGVLAHQIIDIRHRPGRLNPVADGISRKYVNLPTEKNDGHEWTVSEDWEARTGIQNDIFQIESLPTYDALRNRFANEKIFLNVIEALAELEHGKSIRERKKAKHQAEGYMIQDGKLWKIGNTKSTRAKPRVECIPQSEAVTLAWEIHRNEGHFHRDNVKIALMDKIASPHLDQSITKAIMDCGKCKGHGPKHLHSLLEPITRCHPFELLVGDTLAMPKGKGGFIKIGLYADVYSQHVWADKFKTAASAATSCKTFNNICTTFTAPEAFMVDGGREFDNDAVREACATRNVELRVVPGYSPWINGLIEGMNAKLLGRLKRLCSPDLGEDEYNAMDVPASWPDHLEEAVEFLNNCILPHLKFSPNELLLGIVINTKRTPAEQTEEEVSADEVEVQMAYVEQQRLDGYAHISSHAHKRKLAFDRKVLSRAPREVIFKAGQLVQVYRSDLDFTFKAERKMEPKWSAPRRVTSRDRNSYKLETLEGLPIGNRFSSRRLRRFIPRNGTALHEAQAAIENLRSDQEAKRDIVQKEVRSTVIDEDRDTDWEDIEH